MFTPHVHGWLNNVSKWYTDPKFWNFVNDTYVENDHVDVIKDHLEIGKLFSDYPSAP